eukprot:GGOE01021567.1.p1 GENE.GGOE01021567.1~~GGOE01021567.1.p1  ORF type:complete len:640 (-),score=149.32 GGOE01021567.1:278-2023(-)
MATSMLHTSGQLQVSSTPTKVTFPHSSSFRPRVPLKARLPTSIQSKQVYVQQTDSPWPTLWGRQSSPALRYTSGFFMFLITAISWCRWQLRPSSITSMVAMSGDATDVTVVPDPRRDIGGVLEDADELRPATFREAGDRLQRLKELAWTKQVKDDITYAEFAMAVNPAAPSPVSPEKPVGIDYFKIADRLDENLERMERKERWTLHPSEISLLLQRLRSTKESIDTFMLKTHRMEEELEDEPAGKAEAVAQEAEVNSTAAEEGGTEEKKTSPRLQLFVREDGTVDWDGAIERGRELAVFGKEVWARLNGRATEEGHHTGAPSPRSPMATLSSIDERESIRGLRGKVEALEASLAEAHELRDQKQAALWELRAEGKVVTPEMRLEMRGAAHAALELRRKLAIQKLDLDMERICLYLEQEIEQSSSPQEQRMLVAEFGLLDKQLQMLLTILGAWESPGMPDDIDQSELDVLEKEISELKVRLGLDIQGTTIDWGKGLRDFWEENAAKFREGVAFCIKGTRMLFGDVTYALRLFKRTTEGYTLKPREVRTIRRTVKDVLTLIPTLILLIIPMSPPLFPLMPDVL